MNIIVFLLVIYSGFIYIRVAGFSGFINYLEKMGQK